MVPFGKLFLFALGVSALVVERTLAKVRSDLEQTTTDVNSANTLVANYNGGGSTPVGDGIQILSALRTVVRDIVKADDDLKATPTIGSTDATSLGTYIDRTLAPSVKTLANNLVAKNNSRIGQPDFRKLVDQYAKFLKGNTTLFRNDFSTRVSPGSGTVAVSALNRIIADWARFQAAYA